MYIVLHMICDHPHFNVPNAQITGKILFFHLLMMMLLKSIYTRCELQTNECEKRHKEEVEEKSMSMMNSLGSRLYAFVPNIQM